MFCTAATAGRGARTFLQLREGVDPFLADGFDEGALGHAHASTDHFVVGHFGNVEPSIFGRSGEEQLTTLRRQVRLRAQPVHVSVAV